MPPTPTIVAASLDSKALEKSISDLVTKVNTSTKQMADSFSEQVRRMERDLRSLGNTKQGTGGADSDGGSSRRTRALKEEEEQTKRTTQAIREQKLSLDQNAQAMQQAITTKSARDSYYAFFQGYKQQAQELSTYITAFENGLQRTIQGRLTELNNQLASSKERIRQLNEELNRRFYSSGNPQASAEIQAQLDKELQKHNQIEKAIANVNQEFAFEKTYLASLYAEHNRISNIMKDEAATTRQSTDATSQKAEAAKRLATEQQKATSAIQSEEESERRAKEEAKMHAEYVADIARLAKEAHANKMAFDMSPFMNTSAPQYIYSINDARSKGLTIEQQIENILRAQEEAERRIVTATNDEVEAQKRVTMEIEKRTYKAPTTKIDDSFNNMVARTAGVLPSELQATSTKIVGMTNYLKNLQSAYTNLTNAERNTPFGQKLKIEIQTVTRDIQVLRKEMSRPVSLDFIKNIQVKTIDDMIYKMQQLQLYRQGIDITQPGADQKIMQVDRAMKELQKDMDKYMATGKRVSDMNNALGRSWNYMKNRLAFYFTVGASTQFIKNLIEVRSQYEMNERALGILVNSAERGTQVFNELSQMALVSPYTLIELSSAAKQLTAYDVAAKDVVDTTRRLADMASAVGVPMERLTYALGQIKAYGYLNSRDARMFANSGIPLVKQLSEYYTELEGKMVSVGDVYDRMKKKAIDYNDVMAVVTKMTDEGGKFFDFQAKMADTLKVRLANLTLAWNNMLNDMGKQTQGVLTTGIGMLKNLFLRWKDIDKALTSLVATFGVLKAVHLAYYGLMLGTNKAIAIETVLGTKLSNVLRTLGSTMNTVLTSGATWWGLLAVAVGAAVFEVMRGNEEMKEFNKTLRDNAKSTYEDLKKFNENDQFSKIRESLDASKSGKGDAPYINKDEANKTWEAVREQIELSTSASDEFIGKLMQISDTSERLRQGFKLLEDIQEVSGALKELGDNGIKVKKQWSEWWNLWILPDGVIGNLKNAHMWLEKITEQYGSLEEAKKAAAGESPAPMFDNGSYQENATKWLKMYEKNIKEFKEDLEETKQSVLNFINAEGWNMDSNKINEVFRKITKSLIEQRQLDPQQAYDLQIEMENARAEATKKVLESQKASLVRAWEEAEDEKTKISYKEQLLRVNNELKNFDNLNGRNKVEWERFTKFIKEQHLFETREMLRKAYNEHNNSLDMQNKKYTEWVNRMTKTYADSHKMSIDEVERYLKSFVWNANQMQIFIPVILGNADGKTLYQQLTEADSAIDTAYQKIERLKKRQEELRAMGGMQSQDENVRKDYLRTVSEIAEAERDYQNAEKEGGHSKKEDAAARKEQTKAAHAQREAESELQRTLKDEIQLIDKVRSAYSGLMKEGAGRENAIESATSGFEQSVSNINRVLAKFGIEHLDLKKFAGINNPREIVNMLQAQLDKLMRSGSAKPAEIQDLQVKIQDLKLDAEKYDLTMITKGLNNELDRLKEDYELGIELEANPELAGMFVEMFNLDLDSIPKTAEEYSERYTTYLNKYLKEKGSKLEISSLLDLSRDDISNFKKQMEEGVMNEEWFNKISDGYKAVRDARDKEMREAIKAWDKLLEKYAEYEYKQKEIARNADNERKSLVMKFGSDEQKRLAMQIMTKLDTEDNPQRVQELRQDLKELVSTVAQGDDTRIAINVAINEKELQESARVAFEQFQKSPDWITATGDVSNMTSKAIKNMIKSIEAYKRQAKYLDPKQIKQINSALTKLYKETKKDNPFNVLKIAAMEAHESAQVYDDKIEHVEKRIAELESKEGSLTLEQITQLQALKLKLEELQRKREEAMKVDPSAFVAGINTMVAAAKQATQIFTDMMDAIGTTRASRDIKRLFNILEKGGQGAAIGAQFGGYGPLIGAVAGVASGIVQTFADQWSGNASITRSIEESQRSVKKLENAYRDLDEAVNRAYGSAVIGAKRAAIANKQLQLEELRRQRTLEESRKSKNRDDDKIIELSGQIKDLEYEIRNSMDDIVNDLMGISSVGDFAEGLVSEMIEAFKNGEDYMDVFEKKFEGMIDNMIMKSIVSRVVTQYLDALWDNLDRRINDRAKTEATEYAEAQKKLSEAEAQTDKELLHSMMGFLKYSWADEVLEGKRGAEVQQKYQKKVDEYREAVKREEQAAKARLDAATAITDSDIDYIMGEITEIMPELGQRLKDILGQYYKFGESSEHQLSQLQQGIQGISEDTAGALEAYMNGVSQQVYLQSDILMQIRDAVVQIDMDIQLATISQMLFQLQQSYQVQRSIESILSGALVPSGRAFCVELSS